MNKNLHFPLLTATGNNQPFYFSFGFMSLIVLATLHSVSGILQSLSCHWLIRVMSSGFISFVTCSMWHDFFLSKGWVFRYMHILYFLYRFASEHFRCFHLWLLWIMLQWTCVYKYFFRILLSLLLGIINPEMRLLDHRGTCTRFSRVVALFSIPTKVHRGSDLSFSTFFSNTLLFSVVFFVLFFLFLGGG